jgi:hypothetical protein
MLTAVIEKKEKDDQDVGSGQSFLLCRPRNRHCLLVRRGQEEIKMEKAISIMSAQYM